MKIYIRLSLLFVGLAMFAACGQSTAPVTPYLIITPGPSFFFATDSAHIRLSGDSVAQAHMSDWSLFKLLPGTSTGYSDAFVWRVEDTSLAEIHRVIFSVRPSAIISPKSGNVYRAEFFPIVSNGSQFISQQSFDATLIYK